MAGAADQGADEIRAAASYELPAHVGRLFLDGAAVWGRGDQFDDWVVGYDLTNRLVGWAGGDTLTGGAGANIFHAPAGGSSRVTVTDFRPDAGAGGQPGFSRNLFPSPEQAFAAAWQAGLGMWVARGRNGIPFVPLDTRLAERAPGDLLVV